jgi:hypothetical protein
MFRAAALATSLAAGLSLSASAGEQQTFNAFSAWTGKGFTVQSGPNEKIFVGTVSGRIYIETDKGPVDAGEMICPVKLRVNVQNGNQEMNGRCTLAGNDGALMNLDLTCTGVYMVGCRGDSSIAGGGTGRFAGVTGGGPFTIRASQREATPTSTAIVDQTASGIIFWRDFKYNAP